jgi:hypothetical protein
MTGDDSFRREVRLSALVLTPHLKLLTEWLERYFGFTAMIDWVQRDWSAGKIYCRRDQEEILLVGAEIDAVYLIPATVLLLVNDIDSLAAELDANGIEYSMMRDIGERPTIEFYPPSPYHMFSIKEID